MKDLSDSNDRLLVSQLINNDVKAFDGLFHKYSKRLYCFAFSLLKNEEDSREIVQETFYKIWNKRDVIDSSKSFKSFLFKISYNLIIDQLRIKIKDKEYRKFLGDYFKTNNSSNHHLTDYHILNQQISDIVEKLPEKRKQVFKLSREKGLTHQEISSELGISVKTVENQINLTLKQIKKQLGENVLPSLLFLSLFI